MGILDVFKKQPGAALLEQLIPPTASKRKSRMLPTLPATGGRAVPV